MSLWCIDIILNMKKGFNINAWTVSGNLPLNFFSLYIKTVYKHQDLISGCTPGLLTDRGKILKNFSNIIFFKFNFRLGLLYKVF